MGKGGNPRTCAGLFRKSRSYTHSFLLGVTKNGLTRIGTDRQREYESQEIKMPQQDTPPASKPQPSTVRSGARRPPRPTRRPGKLKRCHHCHCPGAGGTRPNQESSGNCGSEYTGVRVPARVLHPPPRKSRHTLCTACTDGSSASAIAKGRQSLFHRVRPTAAFVYDPPGTRALSIVHRSKIIYSTKKSSTSTNGVR